VDGHPIVVILGDNIFQEDLSGYVKAFELQGKGARVLLKRVSLEDARRARVRGDAAPAVESLALKSRALARGGPPPLPRWST